MKIYNNFIYTYIRNFLSTKKKTLPVFIHHSSQWSQCLWEWFGSLSLDFNKSQSLKSSSYNSFSFHTWKNIMKNSKIMVLESNISPNKFWYFFTEELSVQFSLVDNGLENHFSSGSTCNVSGFGSPEINCVKRKNFKMKKKYSKIFHEKIKLK